MRRHASFGADATMKWPISTLCAGALAPKGLQSPSLWAMSSTNGAPELTNVTPGATPDMGVGGPLRIALLVYRGNPHCGGQGVYVRHLSRELVALGHQVEVFSGPPYPVLDPGVAFTPVPSLDLYRAEDPFRIPKLREFKTTIDMREFGLMCLAAFPEPYAFSHRVRRLLQDRIGDFDLIHDNQCLGTGLLGVMDDGWPLMATLHHPITVDRELDFAHAKTLRRKFTLSRWYSFLGMQMKVARKMPRVVTVSQSSRRDIAKQMGVSDDRMAVVAVGVDPEHFRPLPYIARTPGRIMTTTSSDQPMKGLIPLLEALAKVRTERSDAHLVVMGRLRDKSEIPSVLARLGLDSAITPQGFDAVSFVHGVDDDRVVELYAECEIAVVPSLYEGFSLPAIEAMASGVPLIATTGGALPEVVGTDGETGILVPPGDPSALASAMLRALSDRELRGRLGAAGRERALSLFTWRECAVGTAAQYHETLALLGRTPSASVHQSEKA